MLKTITAFTSSAAVACTLAFAASSAAQTQLWHTAQTTSSTNTTSESSVFSTPFAQNREVADDFQVAGTIERVVAGGWGCGSCGAPNVDGVYVRFYEWTVNGPGALQHEVFVPEGDPGFLHETLPYTLDITLPQSFQASGWHFISVQIKFGAGGGVWTPVQANSFVPVNKRVHSRNNLDGGVWAPDTNDFGQAINADAVLKLYGTAATATPVIDSLSHSIIDRSGRLIVQGGLWGAEQGDGQLLVDGLPAIVTQWNSDAIVGYIPEAASLGNVPVQVQTPSGASLPAMVHVTARQQQGRVAWRFEVDADIITHRVGLAPDGSIYVNEYNNGRLYKLTPNGGLVWMVDALRGQVGSGAVGPVVVGQDCTVYVAVNPLGPTVDLLAYNPDGTLKWHFTNPSSIGVAAGPSIGPDGNIYIVFNDFEPAMGAVSFAPNAGRNGGPATPRWSNPGQPFTNVHAAVGTEIAFSSSSVGGPTDQIVVAIHGDASVYLHAFAMADGQHRWVTPGVFAGSSLMQLQWEAAAGPDGKVYAFESGIGSTAFALQSYNPANGSRSWHFNPGILSEVSPPVVGPDGVIYFGWDLGRLTAVSPRGQHIWTHDGGPGGVRRMPAISPNNEIVLFGGGPFGQSGFIKALDAQDGSVLFQVDLQTPIGDIFPVDRPAFTPDSTRAYYPTGIVNQGVGNDFCYLYAIDLTSAVTLGDVNGDGVVNVTDLLEVIGAWGPCPQPPKACDADIAPHPAGDGQVNVSDLLLVIANWG